MKLYFFQSGILKSYRGLFIQNGGDSDFDVPVPFFLIQHRGKNILFDTGNHYDDRESGKHLLPRLFDGVAPVFTDDEWAPNAIQKVGVKPEDIDIIIMSHLHHDHAGAITEFPNATVIVQQAEYDYVRRPDYFMTQAYYNDEAPAPVTNFDFKGTDGLELDNVDWYFLKGWADDKFDLFGDGKIVIYFTPGHTVGHQSLLVRTDNDGDFMFCADACYVSENYEKGVLPGLVALCPEYLQSLKTFRLLSKLGVTIVTGHDPEGWQKFKLAPEFYS